MKGKFVLKPRAQADLDEIWNYTAERWGLDQAETYARRLWKSIQALADTPSLGRECDEVRAGYRQYPSGSHVLFYRLMKDRVEVVRILHERMDYERHIP
jgi:toxin ParE1/3/4